MDTDAGGDLSSGQGRVTPVKASNGDRRRLAVFLAVSSLVTAGVVSFLVQATDSSRDDSWIGPFVVVALVVGVVLLGAAYAIGRSRLRRRADAAREGGAHPQDGDR